MQKNYKHLLMETIIYLGELQRRLDELNVNGKDISKQDQEEINKYSEDSLRLLHALDPCLSDAKIFFPEFDVFIDSCQKALIKIKMDLKAK